MSGKIVRNLKRKRDELTSSSDNPTIIANDNNSCCSGRSSAIVSSVINLSENKCKHEAQLKYHRRDVDDNSDENSTSSSTSTITNDLPKNNDFLQAALIKVQELENELAQLDSSSNSSDSDADGQEEEAENELLGYESEALGFAVCARETLMFLENQGLSRDNPLIISLRNRLIEFLKICLELIIMCYKNKKNEITDENSIKQLLTPLIQWIKIEDDIQELISKNKQNQPFIVVHGDLSFAAGLFYIVFDKQKISLGNTSFIDAIDKLFKTFYVFNLKYEKRLNRFFNFLDVFIYKTPNVNAVSINILIEKQLSINK